MGPPVGHPTTARTAHGGGGLSSNPNLNPNPSSKPKSTPKPNLNPNPNSNPSPNPNQDASLGAVLNDVGAALPTAVGQPAVVDWSLVGADWSVFGGLLYSSVVTTALTEP
eukprot:scaffold18702_cov54-Phaeocystis_antarctica.AAC.3